MREAFEQHIRTGAPVTIPSAHVAELELPDLVRRFLAPGDVPPAIAFGAKTLGDRTAMGRLSVRTSAGEHASLEALRFQVVQAGTEEVTLKHREPHSPWSITLSVNHVAKRFDMALQIQYQGFTAKQVYDCERFRYLLSRGGILNLEDMSSGLFLASAEIPAGALPGPAAGWLAALERLAYIQSRSGIGIVMPHRDLYQDEIRAVHAVAERMESGQATVHGPATLHLEVPSPSAATHVLTQFGNGEQCPLHFETEQVVELFDTTIPLGPVKVTVSAAGLPSEEAEGLRAALASDALPHGVTLVIPEAGVVTYHYENVPRSAVLGVHPGGVTADAEQPQTD